MGVIFVLFIIYMLGCEKRGREENDLDLFLFKNNLCIFAFLFFFYSITYCSAMSVFF